MDDFFISRKLMNIPLVTARRDKLPAIGENPPSNSTAANFERLSSTESSLPTQRSDSPLQLGKRDAKPSHQGAPVLETKMTGETLKILFKPSAVTASTANLLDRKRSSTTTTTRRPKSSTSRARFTSAQIRTTTARPAKSTTSDRSRNRDKQQSGKASPSSLATSSPLSSSSTTTPVRATTTTTTSTSTQAPATSSTTETPTVEPITLSIVASTSTQSPSPSTSVRSPSHLKQISQFVTSAPGYQRRTSQSVSLSKYTNKLSQDKLYAGPHWTLFNEPNGGYSAFEVLALISNVMIVTTIVAVIIFNWFKSIREKRAPKVREAESSVKLPIGRPRTNSPSSISRSTTATELPPEVTSDKTASKISTISGATSLKNSNLSGESLSSSIIKMPIKDLKQAVKVPLSETGEPLGQKQRVIGSKSDESKPAANVSTTAEIHLKQTQTPIDPGKVALPGSNKAMAIVQPTENPNAPNQGAQGNKLASKKELVKENPQAISRSQSDLSRKLAKESSVGNGKDSPGSESAEVTKRVAALEQLFGDSAKGEPEKPSVEPKGQKMAVKTNQDIRSTLVQSSCSLDSIELPANLVENLKRAEPTGPAVGSDAPSPNLLLDQLEPGKLAEKGKRELDSVGPAEISMPEIALKSELATRQTLGQDDKLPGEQKAGAIGEQPVTTEVRQHQVVVVNKLDKRKTNLEIVDIRDDSVTGKMRALDQGGRRSAEQEPGANWISMDGVAVVQQPVGQVSLQSGGQSALGAAASSCFGQAINAASGQPPALSPSEIIETRFNVDYSNSWSAQRARRMNMVGLDGQALKDSQDEEQILNNIESELEQDNRIRNRKYFVYIVHDGHFTAKKECIARIELPQKRRITLAEMRQLIASSQEISMASLRRSKFKFVTETYRLLNEDEDVAVLHQVYPTQGVFLKLNVPEQESQAYALRKGRLRHILGASSSTQPGASNVSQATIASRRRSRRPLDHQDSDLVSKANRDAQTDLQAITASLNRGGGSTGAAKYARSKSNVQRRPQGQDHSYRSQGKRQNGALPLGLGAAGELGANVISGAKRLFSSTFLGGS